ncbi:hypothetical protein EV127DRAFT_150849 [Xylaria flabelliformis]|nr:hypothetical protein EV127DRAFT_150849 [Xylaria flabelliformis]
MLLHRQIPPTAFHLLCVLFVPFLPFAKAGLPFSQVPLANVCQTLPKYRPNSLCSLSPLCLALANPAAPWSGRTKPPTNANDWVLSKYPACPISGWYGWREIILAGLIRSIVFFPCRGPSIHCLLLYSFYEDGAKHRRSTTVAWRVPPKYMSSRSHSWPVTKVFPVGVSRLYISPSIQSTTTFLLFFFLLALTVLSHFTRRVFFNDFLIVSRGSRTPQLLKSSTDQSACTQVDCQTNHIHPSKGFPDTPRDLRNQLAGFAERSTMGLDVSNL